MKLIFLVIVVSLFCEFRLHGQTVVNLFIVEGQVSNGNTNLPYFVFSNTPNFDSSNAVLRFNVGETVVFNVTNNTDFTCAFKVEQHGETGAIAAGESIELIVIFEEEGSFLYEDPMLDHRALGLGGLIAVSSFDGSEFFGVLTEHCKEWIVPIADGGSYDKRVYNPDAFTINGKGFPNTMNDPLAMIVGHVGDTIRIHLANTGQMYHFPHFHGYHVEIVQASYHKTYVGRHKDSFGMAPGEVMVLELIPDKPGRYPMHNHNLVTTTVGGNYPGGMMMHMHIHE